MNTAPRGARARAMLESPVALERPEAPLRAAAATSADGAVPTLAPWLAACANDGEAAFLEAMARECLEDAAGLRRGRAPTPEGTFRDPRRSEQRLLAQLDALLACGRTALTANIARIVDGEVEDPDVWFAAVLALGCVADGSALDEGLRLARMAAERDPAARDAVVEAFQLSPHPAADAAVRPLLRDPSPGLRGFALRVLAHRDALTAADALPHLDDPEPWVASAAAGAFAHLPKRDIPVGLIRLLENGSPDVVRAALWTLLRHGHPQAPYKAAQLCREVSPQTADAIWAIVLFGSRTDAGIVHDALKDPVSSDVVDAAGWFGDLSVGERLLELLGDGREEIRIASAAALTRLTGGGPRAERSVPADERPPNGRPFYAQPLAPHVVEGPSLDRGAWAQWWSERGKTLDARLRTRWGRAWRPADVLAELENGPGDRIHRERLHVELAICAGDEAPRYRAVDFIPAQERAIEAWRAWLSARGAALGAGGWRA